MMQNIGAVDYELRDKLIYSTLNRWAINGVLSPRQMKSLLKTCIDDRHLFYGIGERDTDSVFTRTFSVLIIPLAFFADRKEKFLSEHDVIDIKDKVIRYLELEKDLRGFVEGKGWAHSTAHASDALEDIARSEYIGHDALQEILAAIKHKICVDYYTYIHNEDDRMAVAALSVIKRSVLTNKETADWIRSFGNIEKSGTYPADLHLNMNIRNFLRSLYFIIYNDKNMQIIAIAILDVLSNI